MKKYLILAVILLLTGCNHIADSGKMVNFGAEVKEAQYKTADFKKVLKDNPKDKVEAEFKNKKLKISRWDDEVNLEIELVDDKKTAKEAKIYEVSEGMEFEVDLLEKPESNVIKMNINDKGLDFYYQGELTQEEINEGAFRPENVVGSYAVYYSKSGDYSQMGGKNYKNGKAFHIYRPEMEDANGWKVWGKLHIENGVMSITIPQDFLDNASYPVKHATGATFGYSGDALTSTSFVANRLYNSGAEYAPSSDGTLTSITAKFGNGLVTQTIQLAIYDGTVLVDYTNPTESEVTSAKWYTLSVVNGASISSGSNYYLALASDYTTACSMYYDSWSNYIKYSDYSFGTPPNPISWTTSGTNQRQYGIYATYTPSTPPAARRIIITN